MTTTPNAGSATGIDLAALSTYDPDRDTPGMMELRDTYKDGDYYKVEDVQAALARATPQHPDALTAFKEWAAANGFKITRRADDSSADTFFAYETEQRWIVWQAAQAAMAGTATPQQEPAPTLPEVQADEAKLYRDLTGDAMALGFDGVPAALEALRATPQYPDLDAEVEELAMKHVAVGWVQFKGIDPDADYRRTAQFERLKAFAADLLSRRATPQHSVTEQDERAMFAAAFKLSEWQCLPHPILAGDYADIRTQCSWTGWQAARAQPLASTAATQSEQASECKNCDGVGALYVGTIHSSAPNKQENGKCRVCNGTGRAALAIPASTALTEFVTRESALSAIQHVAESREPGKTIRAAHMLVPASTAASEQQAGADERAKFEAWVRKECNMPDSAKVNWNAQWTRDSWHAWDAALTHRATTATCDTCDGNGVVGFPPDRYEPCPECAPIDAATASAIKSWGAATPDTATTAADQQGDTATSGGSNG